MRRRERSSLAMALSMGGEKPHAASVFPGYAGGVERVDQGTAVDGSTAVIQSAGIAGSAGVVHSAGVVGSAAVVESAGVVGSAGVGLSTVWSGAPASWPAW